MAIEAFGMSTSTLPDGERVKRTVPLSSKTLAALIRSTSFSSTSPCSFTPASKTSIFALVSNATTMFPAGSSPSVGRVMISLIAWPVLLMRTRRLPSTVSPSRPRKLACP